MIGSFLVLSTTKKPDTAFAVGVLSRFLSCAEEDHMRAAERVLRYLRRTTRLGVVYGGSEPLRGFVDADWAGDIECRRLTTDFVFTCNGGPISWASKRQSTVATSTAEAEYVAIVLGLGCRGGNGRLPLTCPRNPMATKGALWLRKLLSTLGVDGGAVPMGGENQSCLALVNNPQATGRNKHVGVAYHMFFEYQARGDAAFFFLTSADMPANRLTKPLPSPVFTAFRAAFGVGGDLGAAAWGAGHGKPLLGECWCGMAPLEACSGAAPDSQPRPSLTLLRAGAGRGRSRYHALALSRQWGAVALKERLVGTILGR